MKQAKRMSEAALQRKVIRELNALGWIVWKWESPGRRGVPDLIALRDGIVIFIEVKTPEGRLSPGQTKMIRDMLRAGALVYLVRSTDDAIASARNAEQEKGVRHG